MLFSTLSDNGKSRIGFVSVSSERAFQDRKQPRGVREKIAPKGSLNRHISRLCKFLDRRLSEVRSITINKPGLGAVLIADGVCLSGKRRLFTIYLWSL